MAYKPSRNKSKDNPYTLDYIEEKDIYIVAFKDINNILHEIEVSKEVFNAFDRFELEDISQIHKYRKHIEHLEISDELLLHRALNKPKMLEEQIEKKILYEDLRKAINKLPSIQKRRLKKYYFDNKSEYQIAKEEGTTQQSVHIGLDRARKKLEEILIKFKN